MNKRKISKRITRKTHNVLVDTLFTAKKQKAWLEVAGRISGPTRNHSSVNLKDIDKNSKQGDTIVVPGKVLGIGELSKKIRICALSFSEMASEKIKKSGSEKVTILEEIKKNPKATGVKILQ